VQKETESSVRSRRETCGVFAAALTLVGGVTFLRNIHPFSTVCGSFPLTPFDRRNTICHLVRIGSVGSALQGLTSASEEGPHKERAHGTYAGIDGSVYEPVV
jgi:hypothetical protein